VFAALCKKGDEILSVVPPRVFVSYSHDSASHKGWVLDLASTLRKRGIDVVLDQWDLKPGNDLPHFMETELVKADYIVVVCTEKYVSKANSGQGGVGYEKGILTASLMKDLTQSKVIPILRGTIETNLPTFLSSKLYINFSNNEEIEYSLDDLQRVLLDAPLYEKPEIGKSPFEPMNQSRPNRMSNGVRSVMSTISTCYNHSNERYVRYWEVRKASELPRLTMDKYIQECRKLGYLVESESGPNVTITPDGVKYLESEGVIE
jgi:hypothetical protein